MMAALVEIDEDLRIAPMKSPLKKLLDEDV